MIQLVLLLIQKDSSSLEKLWKRIIAFALLYSVIIPSNKFTIEMKYHTFSNGKITYGQLVSIGAFVVEFDQFFISYKKKFVFDYCF